MTSTTPPGDRCPSLSAYWKARFGERVHRVSLDAGFSCPNRDGTVGTGGCAFCDPASFSPAAGDLRPVREQLAGGIARLRRRGIGRVAAYFQPHTNTYAPLADLKRVWDQALPFPEVVALCVGTRPDCVPDPVLELLGGYRERWEVWLELGLQSAHDATLERLRRGHTAGQFAEACRRARGRGLRVCAHVILGLPGEGPAQEAETARFLAELGVDGVKLHQLAVVEGTALAEAWRRGEVGVLTEAQYARRAAAFLGGLPAGTVVHRLVGETDPARLLAPHFHKGRVLERIRRARAPASREPGAGAPREDGGQRGGEQGKKKAGPESGPAP
ncbi:MAG: TIGR01212 family radical SAM protein [Deferrisomatales bacterium]